MKLVLPLLVALAYAPAQVMAGTAKVLGSELNMLTIFADTYSGVGATTSATLHSIVYGSILAGGVTTMGSNSTVWGSVFTPEAMSTDGNGAYVSGSIQSGGVLTLGNGSKVDGDITSSGASTIGDGATVGGNMVSGGLLSTGANSTVKGYAASGGGATIGGLATVIGTVSAVGAIAVSADATTGDRIKLAASPIDPASYKNTLVNRVATDAKMVSDAQVTLRNMTDSSAAYYGLNFFNGTVASVLAATMTVDTTLYSGVYSAASLSTTDGITLTLDGQGVNNASWLFNISDILAHGANTTIELINAPGTPSVIWNSWNVADAAKGYTSIGDSAHIIGTILANTYVSVGANATVESGDTTCGGIYSATSYVSTGDSAVVGGFGCGLTTTPAIATVPEPGSLAMLLTGLGLLGFMVRRKQQA